MGPHICDWAGLHLTFLRPCTYTRAYTQIIIYTYESIPTHIYTPYIFTYTHVFMHTRAGARARTHTQAYTHLCVNRAYIHGYTYVHAQTYIRINLHANTPIDTFIHTYIRHIADQSTYVYKVETGISLIRGQLKETQNHADLEAHKFLVTVRFYENRTSVPFPDFEFPR
jgi:hypothetical protein